MVEYEHRMSTFKSLTVVPLYAMEAYEGMEYSSIYF
jgi:hypothetical protein